MTAMLAARMVADGRVRWEDAVGALLSAPEPWPDTGLAEFLTHRSGMAANLSMWRTLLRPGRGRCVTAMLKRSQPDCLESFSVQMQAT